MKIYVESLIEPEQLGVIILNFPEVPHKDHRICIPVELFSNDWVREIKRHSDFSVVADIDRLVALNDSGVESFFNFTVIGVVWRLNKESDEYYPVIHLKPHAWM